MNVGIALGASGAERAGRALRLANEELEAGNKVELFLVFKGVGLFELADRDAPLGRLLAQALAAGLELSACRACVVAHGARRSIRCETSAFRHLFTMWRGSDRFVFMHRLKRAA
jgi:predicted peroxiredoxin